MAVFNAYQLSASSIMIGGINVPGIKKIEFEKKQDKSNNYAASNQPYSRSRKNKEYSGSLTMYFREKINLISSAGVGTLDDIAPFDMIFLARTDAGELVTYTLKDCEFMNDKTAFENAGDDSELDVDIIFSSLTTVF